MDYEKEYNNAIKRAKQAVKISADAELVGALIETIFPELRESEDEMINDTIFNCLYQCCDTGFISDKQRDDALVYLKKQKEQKPAEWSEKDEEILGRFLGWLQGTMGEKTYSSWLKSLRERFNLQPKQKWSEEDEERLDSIIESYKVLLKDYKACHDVDFIPYNSDIVIRNVVDDINFLKSLRPQTHWKPTEEQMTALDTAIACVFSGQTMNTLQSLYNDLQKL